MESQMLTEAEFDRRVETLVRTASSLLGGSGTDPNEPAAHGMSKGQALAFYEKIIDKLDTQLEKMAQEFVPPFGGTNAPPATQETTK